MLDPWGTLFACEGGARRMVRYGPDGGVTVLADGFEGKRLNIPNDLAIDLDGRVWFTDPYYEGSGGPWSEDRANKDLEHDSVYRLDPQTDGSWSINRVTFDTTRPNGLLFSLGHDVLYVAQSGRLPEEYRQLRGYPVLSDGSLGEHEVLHDFGANRGIDGMVLDTEGTIIATAGWPTGGPGPMIYVFSPSGEVLEMHPVPAERPTNCSFGDADLRTLYVTSTEGPLVQGLHGIARAGCSIRRCHSPTVTGCMYECVGRAQALGVRHGRAHRGPGLYAKTEPMSASDNARTK